MPRKAKGGGENAMLASNRAAPHEYILLERFEAGIVLTGTEVKTARAGRVSLKEAYARVQNGEVFLHGAHFSPYEQGNRENADPLRVRKLLLHAKEIRKIARRTESGGMTLVPISLYLKGGRVKIEIAVAQGKKSHDKREAARNDEAKREMSRLRGMARR